MEVSCGSTVYRTGSVLSNHVDTRSKANVFPGDFKISFLTWSSGPQVEAVNSQVQTLY